MVCYSSLPADALQSCVTTLCHTLNIERFSRRSLEVYISIYGKEDGTAHVIVVHLQVMLRLLGTHLGRSAIYTMCILIQERYAYWLLIVRLISANYCRLALTLAANCRGWSLFISYGVVPYSFSY